VTAKLVRAILACAIGAPLTVAAIYDVPPDRRIPWNAGLDPEGGIPRYSVSKDAVADYSADNKGSSDATAAIQNCVNGVSRPGACSLRAGTYRVDGTINMPAQVVLRGGGPGRTLLNMSAGASIVFIGGSKEDMGAPIGISSGFTKGSMALTLNSTGGLAVDDWISVYENNPPGLVDSSRCGWCGDDSGSGQHVIQQFARITAIAGNTISINRPLYFSYSSGNAPSIRTVPFGVFKSGLEDLKLVRTASPDTSLIRSTFARHCWLRNIETIKGGDNNGEQHVSLWFSHGIEVRDSYFHDGYAFGSGANYGVHIIFWNSDHKVENNIFYSLRHGVNLEGGGSGSAILYNYFDGHYESEDTTFLDADLNPNHGAHPMMVLSEGNSSAKLVWDSTLGSSSHQTAFRNHVRIQRSMPAFSWGRWGIDVQANSRFMNIIGNVVGGPESAGGTVLANGNCEPQEPTFFRFGCSGQPGSYADSQSRSTAILHGNYDYTTAGVAAWDGGSDHALASSFYYSSKPAFFGKCAWPAIGPDLNPLVGTLPAKARYEGTNPCGITTTQAPPTPVNPHVIRD
jgi:hypothetical protein